MLFNSYAFLLGFLPVVLLAFVLVHRGRPAFSVPLLGIASLAFYAWWNPHYLILMLASILFNFGVAHAMHEAAPGTQTPRKRRLLILGVVFNLAALGYFKYAKFLLDIVGAVSGADVRIEDIVLPLGISFFTFTQIAFLVDAYRDEPAARDFPSYLLFVTFFPHLIAGPIYHHREMLPQFARLAGYRLNAGDFAAGSTIFVIGLFKKTVLADGSARHADGMFALAAAGSVPGGVEAWCGTLAYALQIYFDFSGYSDMAIGLARLFGIALPNNFFSPYKAASIIEFWRRWHMSLSRFLRDYLYIALGGNRRGAARTQVNIAITMLLGGLWHGANWTFVAWGAAHGALLILNHAWRRIAASLGLRAVAGSRVGTAASTLLTFACVLLTWVLFRADSLAEALRVYRGMLGAGNGGAGADCAQRFIAAGGGWCVALLAIAWFAPNSQELLGRFGTALETYPERAAAPEARAWWRRFCWQPNAPWAVGMAAVTTAALLAMSGSSRFLYFQF